MSIFSPTHFPCPNCGTENEFNIFASINADRRPDLRDDIINGDFMRIKCTSCETDFRPEPDLNYLDFGNGAWLLARPISAIAHWAEEEASAKTLFDDAYGSNTPAAAQEIGNALTARVTFGWPAVREKIIIAQENLDDVALEKTKISILRNKPGNPVGPGVELRLLAVHGTVFHLGWIRALTNEALEVFEMQRALYEDIAADEAWAELGNELSAGLFVDMQRLFIVPVPYEPEAAE